MWAFVQGFAGSAPPFLGRERAAVDVDLSPEQAPVGVYVDPERRSPRYHETSLALEIVEESGATYVTSMLSIESSKPVSFTVVGKLGQNRNVRAPKRQPPQPKTLNTKP